MDTKRLAYFCAIVEQGRISRAAKALHMSQPPLSQRLKELEEELGTTLILRENGQWHVTDAGKILYERARTILADLDDVKRQVRDTADRIGGVVNIGVSTTCETRLLGMLPAIHREYPDIRFRLAVMDSPSLERNIQEKKLDLAILLLPLEDEGYDLRRLPSGGFSVVYHLSVAPRDSGSVRLDMLEDIPLLLSRRSTGGGSYAAMMRHWQERDTQPRIILDSSNIDTLLRLIDMGMPAAAIVPTSEITAARRASLPVRDLDHEEMRIHPVLISKQGRFLSRGARLVADTIVNNAIRECF